jgi:hypothetical protein
VIPLIFSDARFARVPDAVQRVALLRRAGTHAAHVDPGSAAHHAEERRHSTSKTRVNALMAASGERNSPSRQQTRSICFARSRSLLVSIDIRYRRKHRQQAHQLRLRMHAGFVEAAPQMRLDRIVADAEQRGHLLPADAAGQ